jgi:ribosomal protein S6
MPEEPELKTYEIPIWLRPPIETADEERLISEVRQKLAAIGAEIIHESKALKRNLAYPIAKMREGIFVVFDVAMPASAATKIREAFRHDASILRVGVFEKKVPPKPLSEPMRPPPLASRPKS